MLKASSVAVVPPDQTRTSSRGLDNVSAEIRDVLQHLRRRRRVIVLAALMSAALGTILAGFLPRLYVATTQIMIDPRDLRVFDKGVVPSGELSEGQSSLVETQSKILKSDNVLNPVIENERLAEDPEFNGSARNALSAAYRNLRTTLLGPEPSDKRAITFDKLSEAVKVQHLAGTFVVELSVGTQDAEKSARLAQQIAAGFIANQAQTRQDAARRVSEGLSMRLDELSAGLQRAEHAVDTFKRENNILDTNGRPVNEQQLGDLTNQLTAARLRTGEARARTEQITRILRSGTVPDATAEVLQSPAIAQLRARYATIKQNQDNLLTSLGPRHPSLLATQAQVQGVRQLIFEEIGRIGASARNDLERAKANETSVARQVEAITKETGTVNTASIRLRELEREAQARRAVYESFLARAQETRQQGDLPITNISVIAAATAPLRLTGLPPLLVVAIVAALGAGLAATLCLAFDQLKGRLMTPRQVSLATDLPVLAIAKRRARSAAGFLRFGARPAGPRPRTSGTSLAQLQDALIDVAPRLPPRVVLFLSASGHAADARLPLDLARRMCGAGDRVLLIDADGDAMTRSLSGKGETGGRGWPSLARTDIPNLSVASFGSSLSRRATLKSPGGPDALLHLALDHAFVFVHASTQGSALRLRDLAESATNIVLLIDADAASAGTLDAVRQQIGPCGSKVDGFVWVASDRIGHLNERDTAMRDKSRFAQDSARTGVA